MHGIRLHNRESCIRADNVLTYRTAMSLLFEDSHAVAYRIPSPQRAGTLIRTFGTTGMC